MSNQKLGVEVICATDLIPKDEQGSSSPYVELAFNGQKVRTTVKERDLNPVWNERFYFNAPDDDSLHNLTLEAQMFSHYRGSKARYFLGKVPIAGISFVPYTDATVIPYPLQKRGMFSRVKGELSLKVYLTKDPSIRPSNPLPAINPFTSNPPPAVFVHAAQAPPPTVTTETKQTTTDRHISYTIPKENKHQGPIPMMPEHPPQFSVKQMKSEQVQAMPMYAPPPSYKTMDYTVKETKPLLGGGQFVGGHLMQDENPSKTFDLVEKMQYLFVRVVKARDLPTMDITGSLDPYIEVKVGNYKGKTRTFEKNKNPEWNEVFAFSRERIQASVVEVLVKDKDLIKDDFVGIVRFNLHDIPSRVPPDSPLAPEWYRLESMKGESVKGELMVAIWMGTQADEAFPSAWHTDAAESSADTNVNQHIRSKVYHAPRLWYVRVNVIEAQDIISGNRSRFPNLLVKAKIGNQVRQSRSIQSPTQNPTWNEDLVLVAAEPFDDRLVISVEDHVGSSKYEVVGSIAISLGNVERRVDDRAVDTRWYSLEKPVAADEEQPKKDKFSSRIHLRVCLDGGYHVFDESTHYSSDLRPSAKQLWKPSIGLLELGIISADGFHPQKTRDGKGTADSYCVAKYGQKWVRTRTIINNLSPKFNEQYTWEVYDPATVLTVGVFDSSQIGEKSSNDEKDLCIGKVRIRLSTLQVGRIYTHAYPLIVLHPSGVKKMGELHLAIRFSSTSYFNLMGSYSRPLLPEMHYIQPLTLPQLDYLRHQAVNIMTTRLGRMEPPLRKEVVEYMCDNATHMWSMRKSKANFYRLVSVFSGLLAAAKLFVRIRSWESPITTVPAIMVFLLLTFFPEFILPTIFFCMFIAGLKNFWYRPQNPPHMNIQVSRAENVHPDELDEEFDSFPTIKNMDLVRMRYERLRAVAGRIQTVLGDVATQGERLQALISWRDPRATTIFLLFCLLAVAVLFVVPIQLLLVILSIYIMKPPRFRNRMPSPYLNFFRRLPAMTDSML